MDSGTETEENEILFDTSHRPKYSLSSFDRKRRTRRENSEGNASMSRFESLCERFGGGEDSDSADNSDSSVNSEYSSEQPSKSKGSQTPNIETTRQRHSSSSSSSSSSVKSNRDNEQCASDNSESYITSPSFSEITLRTKSRSRNHLRSSPINEVKPKRLSTAEKLFAKINTGGTSNNSFSYKDSYIENSFSDISPSNGGGNSSFAHEFSETDEDVRSDSSVAIDVSKENDEEEGKTTKVSASKKSGKRKRRGRPSRPAKKSKVYQGSNHSSEDVSASRRSTRKKTFTEVSSPNCDEETDIESDSVYNDVKRSTRGQKKSKPCPASKKSNKTASKNNTEALRGTKNKPCPASTRVEPVIVVSESEPEEEEKEIVKTTRSTRSKPCPASKKRERKDSGDSEGEEEKWRSKTTLSRSSRNKPRLSSKKQESKHISVDSEEEEEEEIHKAKFVRSTRSSSSTKNGRTSEKAGITKKTPNDVKSNRPGRGRFSSNENTSTRAALNKPCPASMKRRGSRKPIWETYNDIDYPSFTVDGLHRKFFRGDYVKVRDSDCQHLHKIGHEQIMLYNWPLKRLYHYFDDIDRNYEQEVKYYDDYLREEYKKLENAKKQQIKMERSYISPKKHSPSPMKRVTFGGREVRSIMTRAVTFPRSFKTKAELKDMSFPSGLRPVASRLAKASEKLRSQKMLYNKKKAKAVKSLRASGILKRSKAIAKKSKIQMVKRQRRHFKAEAISESESDIDSESDNESIAYFHECDIFTSINLSGENKTAALLLACKDFDVRVNTLSSDIFETYMRKIEVEREEDVRDLMDHILDTIQNKFDEEMLNESESSPNVLKRRPGPRRRRVRR